MDRTIVGILLMSVAAIWLLSLLFPRMRAELSRGPSAIGVMTFVGFALFMGGGGAALFCGGMSLPGPFIIGSIILILGAWVLAAIGITRANRRRRATGDYLRGVSATKTRSISPRLVGLVAALALGDFLYLRAQEGWSNYWLLKDGQQGMATVQYELWSGHNGVAYLYKVDKAEYWGKSGRNWQDPKYSNVAVGGKSVVYYSASHPWISSLNQPRGLMPGLPVVLVVLIIEFFALATVINPRGKWAFNLQEKPPRLR